MIHISILSLSDDEYLGEVDVSRRHAVTSDERRMYATPLPERIQTLKAWVCAVLGLKASDVYLAYEPMGMVLA